MKTLVIAEAGVNHNGDLEMALALIDAAADAGADIVKFQTFTAGDLVTATAPRAEYQRFGNERASQYELLKPLELSREAHHVLAAHCRACGVGFLSTAFSTAAADMLMELDPPFFKIPSGEITNLPYLRHIGRLDRPVLLSTGMATLPEVEAALALLQEAGLSRRDVTVLHCTSAYPAPVAEVNLRAMLTIRDTFAVRVGYSDHTIGVTVPIAAVALGAEVIEKHFTLDRGLPGVDHIMSLEPAELREMVRAIREVEEALGDGVKRPTASESDTMRVVRKSLVAARAIQAGEVFSESNITAKRPATGVSPMLWDSVLGRRAPRDFAPDELIEL